jgi:tetraprenyl-beta-curcumene synthase
MAFLAATRIYWLEVWPFLRAEMREWRRRAEAIPDETLRRVALDAQHAKRGNLEGAVAFATLAGCEHRLHSARAMAAYEAAFDYLDCLCEMPNADPLANGRQLTQALIVAVQPGRRHDDYYAHHCTSEDGGYLRALVDACQTTLGLMPAYSAVGEALLRVSNRIVAYQSFNHGDARGSHDAFARWALSETASHQHRRGGPELRWWEIGAAGGSSLAAFALIAAAADPHTGRAQADAIDDAYFPWIGAVNSLLDSLVDQQEDDAPGQHRLLDYYASSEQATDRLEFITKQAMLRAQELNPRHGHELILAAMTSFYLSCPEAQALDLHRVRERLRKSIGIMDAPTMFIMRARRTVGAITRDRPKQVASDS